MGYLLFKYLVQQKPKPLRAINTKGVVETRTRALALWISGISICERWCAVGVRRARLEADVSEVRKVRGRGARTAKGGRG